MDLDAFHREFNRLKPALEFLHENFEDLGSMLEEYRARKRLGPVADGGSALTVTPNKPDVSDNLGGDWKPDPWRGEPDPNKKAPPDKIADKKSAAKKPAKPSDENTEGRV